MWSFIRPDVSCTCCKLFCDLSVRQHVLWAIFSTRPLPASVACSILCDDMSSQLSPGTEADTLLLLCGPSKHCISRTKPMSVGELPSSLVSDLPINRTLEHRIISVSTKDILIQKHFWVKDIVTSWIAVWNEHAIFGFVFSECLDEIHRNIANCSRTPLTRIDRDGEPSGYAENPDNGIFLWKWATLAVRNSAVTIYSISASKYFDRAWFEVLEAITVHCTWSDNR